FSSDALAGTIQEAGARLLITADGGWRRGQTVPLKNNADEAVATCPTIEHVVVVACTGDDVPMTPKRDLRYADLVAVQPDGCAPDWPDKDRFWSVIEHYRATILYTAPTVIRAFMRWGVQFPSKHDLSSLRLLGSVGEPINPEAWMWYYRVIGGERCPVVDTWWQTETGAIMITPLPGVTTLKPGSATRPFPGISAELRNERGDKIEVGGGLLALTRPWPSMLRGIYGD